MQMNERRRGDHAVGWIGHSTGSAKYLVVGTRGTNTAGNEAVKK